MSRAYLEADLAKLDELLAITPIDGSLARRSLERRREMIAGQLEGLTPLSEAAQAALDAGIRSVREEGDVTTKNDRHEECPNCGRPIANEWDEEICDTGACGCPTARSLCWRRWNGDQCCELSPYDPLVRSRDLTA